MESADLNSSPRRDETRLEVLLRQSVAPLSDDGFSQRVLAALPRSASASVFVFPRQAARPNWHRLAACAVGATIGGIIAYAGDASLTPSAAHLEAFFIRLGDPNTLAALCITTTALLYVLRPRGLTRLLR